MLNDMRRMRREAGALLLVTMTLSGCVRWHPSTSVREALGETRHTVVHVFPLEGPGIYVFDARILGDSLQGEERTPVRRGERASGIDRARGYRAKSSSIALSSVRSVETSTTSVKSGLLAVVAVLGIVTVVGAMTINPY
jgi:hypothetical protein